MRAPGVHVHAHEYATLHGVQFCRIPSVVEFCAGTAEVGDVMDALEVGGDGGGAVPASNANTSIITAQHV